jgi:hypothetical protein
VVVKTDTTVRKVVVNACFGGFGLSAKAEMAYLARKGKQAYFFTNARDAAGRPDFDAPYVAVSDPDNDKSIFITYTFTSPDQNEESWFHDRDIPRDDPDLVAVVEELGAAASGRHAALAVVEIPADVEWEIHEYDGSEHVMEKHRAWYP